MRSNLETPERQRATQIMRQLLVRNALYDRGEEQFSGLNPVNAAVLEKCGLLAVTEITPRSGDLIGLIATPGNAKRIAAPVGPLVFVQGEGTKISVLSPADLLAERETVIRLAAVRYFQELPAGTLAKRTRDQLENAHAQIASDKQELWLSAAKGLFNILHNDIYLTLTGFNQSYTQGYKEGVQAYLPRILRPDAEILTSVELDHWNPSFENNALSSAIRRLADIPALQDAVAAYCRIYGHLPLTGPLGLGEVVRVWSNTHPPTDHWTVLWEWADTQPSPLPRYHIASAFLANPKLVPAGSENTLWAEITEVVGEPSEGVVSTRSSEAWLLRDQLATHFGNYLECLLPGLISERLMGMAWWLTERLCELFPVSPGILKKVRETTVKNALESSSLINQLTHPPLVPSGLRYLTRVVNRTWSSSILCELGSARWLFERANPSEVERGRLEDALIRVLIQGYPLPEPAVSPPTYAFDLPLAPVVQSWCELVRETKEEKREAIRTFLEHARQLASKESLPELVELLAGGTREGLSRVAQAIKLRAYTDPGVGVKLWTLLNQDTIWTKVLHDADDEVLSLLFEALTELSVRDGYPWRAAVPHMFAITAAKSDRQERRNLLFGLTLFASLNAGTTSALDRLMHGSFRHEFSIFASRWHDQLKSGLKVCTPWAAARIRSILPSLVLDPLPGSDH